MDSSPFLSEAPPVPATQVRGRPHGTAPRPVSGAPVWRARRGGRPGAYGSRQRHGTSSGHVFRHGETHSRRPSSSPSVLAPAPPPASPARMPPKSPCQQSFTCWYAPFSPTRVEHSVPAAHARLASWPRRRCAWATAGERARWCCQPAAARGYRPPWPSGDGRGARRRVCTSRSSSNRFASVGGSTQISVSRLTRSAARARI